MKKILILLISVICISTIIAQEETEHGIYTLAVKNIKKDFAEVDNSILTLLDSSNFVIESHRAVASPDRVREEKEEHCGFSGSSFVLTSTDYTKMLTSFGNKYLTGAFIRIGLYETTDGVHIVIADPETINRILFNDLFENDEIEKYNSVIKESKKLKQEIITLLHEIEGGEKIEEMMPPIRCAENIAEASKDMFMMVGSLTFFTDEDQFPVINEIKKNKTIFEYVSGLKNNIKAFEPDPDDINYRWAESKDDLKWEAISEEISPDSTAVLLGLTRPRTEAVSFNIAGASREDETNLCPGLDHLCAYPIEVLIIEDEDVIKVYSPREMFRMDMYFWDAGMNAFMNHMSMPAILDESIYKALFKTAKD
ncbi:MAG: hypothetical protein JEY94_09070 [Melioribacteraceae bacterium]|nr:hypothetical protein [Melioribacteraceae bacterium]